MGSEEKTGTTAPAAPRASTAALAGAALRVAFGIIWIINAALIWSPRFGANYVGYLHNAAEGQPAWSSFWFATWLAIVTPNAGLFLWLTRLATTALALAVLFGFARRSVYVLGALYSLLVWSTAEGFGGPYTVGASNMGVGILYFLLFAVLIVINSRGGTSPYSLDYYIERRWRWWGLLAEWRLPPKVAATLPIAWRIQIPILVGIILLIFFLLAGLQSTMNVKPATPDTAAAAVSPLALMSKDPVKQARDARLPPLTPGDSVTVKIAATDRSVEIASGVEYRAWTFEDTVPGPVIHVRQGQMINVELTNHGTMHHSIDFHAAFTPPNLSFHDINPGETIKFSFKAEVPGAFVYHCGTDPVLLHMANGMYGAIIVDPVDKPLPPADEEYVIVQSEWYTQQISGNVMGPDFQKMQRIQPDEVVFNGTAFQYKDHPLTAEPGKRVRMYVVNAGPSVWSAFHIIGSIFDKVYPDGDPDHALSGVSTYSIGPGEGAVFDSVIKEPGTYPFVDHSFAHLNMGAVGVLDVRTPGTEHAKPVVEKAAPTAAAAPAKPEPTGPYTFDAIRATQLYTSTCAACHQANGEGLTGAFPPLKGNAAVLAADPAKHIQVILNGLQGEVIDGVSYPSPMPPFGATLNDTDVADIVNHERTSWGNKAPTVTPEQVKALRH